MFKLVDTEGQTLANFVFPTESEARSFALDHLPGSLYFIKAIDPAERERVYDVLRAELEPAPAAHAPAPDRGMNVHCICGAEFSLVSNLMRHVALKNA